MREPTIDDSLGLGLLHAATLRIAQQFHMGMTRSEAKANLDARSILFRCANKILNECGEMITYEEVEGARILEKIQ